jgi:signal transduction histidine kinase
VTNRGRQPGRKRSELAGQPAQLGAFESPDALLEGAAARSTPLLGARGVALYVHEAGALRRRSARELAPPEVLGEADVLPTRVRPRNALALLRPEVAIIVRFRPGPQLDVLVALGPKRSGDINTHDAAAALTTIAARVEAEWLRFQKRVADRESQEKTNLLGAASHDLRQPLHTASLLAEALALIRHGDPGIDGSRGARQAARFFSMVRIRRWESGAAAMRSCVRPAGRAILPGRWSGSKRKLLNEGSVKRKVRLRPFLRGFAPLSIWDWRTRLCVIAS